MHAVVWRDSVQSMVFVSSVVQAMGFDIDTMATTWGKELHQGGVSGARQCVGAGSHIFCCIGTDIILRAIRCNALQHLPLGTTVVLM